MKITSGDIFDTNAGDRVVVLEYISSSAVRVFHLDGTDYIGTTSASSLRQGAVANPLRPSVVGVGYIGIGKHQAMIQGMHSIVYTSWRNMLIRVYDKKVHARFPSYIGTSVVDEWHNFQVFAEWFYAQEYSLNESFDLDKDLLVFGNKTYGPETCSYVPKEINYLLLGTSDPTKGNIQGVTRVGDSYRVRISKNNVQEHLGMFPTEAEAYAAYKAAKEAHVKEKALEYEYALDERIFNNLMQWELPACHGL